MSAMQPMTPSRQTSMVMRKLFQLQTPNSNRSSDSQQQQQQTATPNSSSIREVQRTIAALQKENFDLKLQLDELQLTADGDCSQWKQLMLDKERAQQELKDCRHELQIYQRRLMEALQRVAYLESRLNQYKLPAMSSEAQNAHDEEKPQNEDGVSLLDFGQSVMEMNREQFIENESFMGAMNGSFLAANQIQHETVGIMQDVNQYRGSDEEASESEASFDSDEDNQSTPKANTPAQNRFSITLPDPRETSPSNDTSFDQYISYQDTPQTVKKTILIAEDDKENVANQTEHATDFPPRKCLTSKQAAEELEDMVVLGAEEMMSRLLNLSSASVPGSPSKIF